MHFVTYVNNSTSFLYGFVTLKEVISFTDLLRSLDLTFTHFFQE